MSSTDKINQLFWLYYGQAIKDKAGAQLGKNGVFFLATEAQKGPPAGDTVPDAYTYQGLYDLGNNLLAEDSVFYTPSALHGYAQALQTFLDYVDLGGHNDPALEVALLNALKDQDAAQIKADTELDKADAQFTKQQKLGLTGTQTFSQWVASGKAQGYIAATNNLSNIGTTIQQIQSQQAGPLAATLATDRANLAKGFNIVEDFTGFNMHCAMGNVLSPAEVLRLYNSNKPVPEPAFQRLPAYNAPNYKTAVQTAQTKSGNKYDPAASVEFTIDSGKSTSDFKFGQTTGGANIGVSWGGWFSFNAGGSHSSSSETLDTSDESTSVNVKITFDNIQIVNITPGSWNIDISKYKLKASAPDRVKTLVRPSGMIVASRIGYQITVGAKTASTLDSKLKSTTSAGGGISIFGIPISLGGSGSRSTEENSHVGTWDNASKTLTVEPTSDTGFATIVGVIGEKFNIL